MSIINKFVTSASKEEISRMVACLDSSTARKRAYVGLIALNALINFLDASGVEIDAQNNCYNNPLILNEFDVADIRLKNNIKIDVRAIVGDGYPQMWIPQDHKEYDLMPDIYVGVKIDKKLNRAELIGFIAASEVDLSDKNEKYFIMDAALLRPMSDLYSAINTICPRQSIYYDEVHTSARELFLPYLDNSISGIDKEFLIKHLSNCESCRKDFYELYKLNNEVRKIKNENLAYYLNLKDYENDLLGCITDSASQIDSQIFDEIDTQEDDFARNQEKAKKFDFWGGLKSIFGRKSLDIKPLYVGLSGIVEPEAPAVEIENLEMQGVEEALDIIFNSEINQNESIDFAQVVENLNIEDLSAKQEIKDFVETDNNPVEEQPALAECNEELASYAQETDSSFAEELPVGEENQNNQKRKRRYTRWFSKLVQITENPESDNDEEFTDYMEIDLQEYKGKESEYTTLMEEELAENLELDLPEEDELIDLEYTMLNEEEFLQLPDEDFQADTVAEELEKLFDDTEKGYTEITEEEFSEFNNKNSFKDLAEKMQDTNTDLTPDQELIRAISEQYNLDEIIRKPSLLNSTLEATKMINQQYDILKGQEGKKEVEANIIESMLSQLDDVEIIDSSEAIQTLAAPKYHYINREDKTDIDMPELEEEANNTRKSNLIKAAAVLTAAGILTCSSLMINDYANRNKAMNDTLANTPPPVQSVPQSQDISQDVSSNQPVPGQANDVNNLPPQPAPGGTLGEHLAAATDQGMAASPQYSVSRSKNVSDVLATAFINQGHEIKITNVSWEVGISLANDPAFKNYLMVTGQALKTALSRQLLNASDIASNDLIKVQVILDLRGNVKTANVQSSSGSKQIDGIVLQTLKEIFNYTKLPRMQSARKDIDASVIINL